MLQCAILSPEIKGFASIALASVRHGDEGPSTETVPGGRFRAPRHRHNLLKYNDIIRKSPQEEARGVRALLPIRSEPLKPLVRHAVQIASIQIGHHDSVGTVVANIGGVDPNQLAGIQAH